MGKKILLNRMKRNPFFMVGGILAIVIVILCFTSPLFVQFDAEANTLGEKLLKPEGFSNGLYGHVFGTDQMGRDVMTRLLIGGRYSLSIGSSGNYRHSAGHCRRLFWQSCRHNNHAYL